MSNPSQPKLVRTTEVVMLKVGDDKWDVVERTIEGRVVQQKKHERGVSLPVARERWEIVKRARGPKNEGWQ